MSTPLTMLDPASSRAAAPARRETRDAEGRSTGFDRVMAETAEPAIAQDGQDRPAPTPEPKRTNAEKNTSEQSAADTTDGVPEDTGAPDTTTDAIAAVTVASVDASERTRLALEAASIDIGAAAEADAEAAAAPGGALPALIARSPLPNQITGPAAMPGGGAAGGTAGTPQTAATPGAGIIASAASPTDGLPSGNQASAIAMAAAGLSGTSGEASPANDAAFDALIDVAGAGRSAAAASAGDTGEATASMTKDAATSLPPAGAAIDAAARQPIRIDLPGQTAQPHAAAHAGTAQPAEQVALTLMRGVQSGIDRMRIQLSPSELGHVDVQIETGARGQVDVVIRADRPETLALMERDARELARALQQAGLDVGDGSFRFERGDGGDGKDRPASGRPGGDAPVDGPDATTLTATALYRAAPADGALNLVI